MFKIWFGVVFMFKVCLSSKTRAPTSVVRNIEDVVQCMES